MLRKFFCVLILCCGFLGAQDAALADTTSLNDGGVGTGTNQFEFVGSWTAGADWLAYGGDEHYSNTPGSYAQVRFDGAQVKVFVTKDPRHGYAGFSIDGGPEVWYDTYW